MRRFVRLALVGLTFHASQVGAQQEVAFAERGPYFLLAANGRPERIDATKTPLLRQRISLDLRDVSMHEAITAIARQSGLQLMFSEKILSRDRTVTLRAEAITVAAALTEVLLDAEVDVLFSRSGNAALIRRSASDLAAIGTITGRVTDASTHQGVPGVRVSLEGTRWGTTTGSTGSYRLAGVAAGAYTLVTRRLGYRGSERAVLVEDDREVTLDLTLEPVPSALNEVVVTATGEQRRVELGHVVGRINADSVVKAAPVSTVSELLNGRVPGLQVNTYQGTVGGNVNIQIRSPNSIQLSTQPIIVVDGVRYTHNAADRISLGDVNFVEPTSPLNDLNPNAIESIEVVKGPSAATLYGTDASNGVIIITTKRGRPGPARWAAYVKGGMTSIPVKDFEDAYFGWRSTNGVPSLFSCPLMSVAFGSCTQDSVSVIRNALNDPSLTMFASQPQWQYGVNVSGGSQGLRYFVAADVDKAIGPVQMPGVLADSISKVRAILDEQVDPNALSKLNLRTNLTAKLGSNAGIQMQGGYSQRSTRTFGGGFANPYAAAFTMAQPGSPYGRAGGPDQFFSRTTTEQVKRFFASATAHYSPTSWLQARAVGGVDLGSITRFSLAQRGDAPNAHFGLFNLGAIADERGRQLATTAELSATGSFVWNRLSSRTAIGTQYVRTVDDLLGTSGTGLAPGAATIGAAANVTTQQNYREQVTLGSYFEQTFGLGQRLFITGAVRADGASTFGRDYDIATYPKASVSWLISEEPVIRSIPHIDDVRLRYAFGAAGQQPRPEWARPGFALQQGLVNGGVDNVYTVNTLGNPELRPEVVREHEFGLDVAAATGGLEFGLTWFHRKTVDQIVSVTLPPGLGTMQTNLGLTAGRGFEAQIAVRPIDSHLVSWRIALQHSFHRTTVRDLGGAAPRRFQYGGWVEGYPLGSRFVRPLLGFEDANGDGIINAFTELQFGDTTVYAGESMPPQTQTLVSTLTFLQGRLRVSGLIERRSGFTQLNVLHGDQCGSLLCRAAVDPATPLADQARAAARVARHDFAFIEPGDYTRFREMNVTAEVPAQWIGPFGFQSATVSVQGRNLALWTSYSGSDPESTSVGVFQELGIPQGRTWALRFDVNF